MKRNQMIAAGIGIIVLILILLFFLKPKPEAPTPETPAPVGKKQRPCPGDTLMLVNKDPLMRGVLAIDEKFKVITNYYDCHPPQRGDLVYFPIASSPEPVVRRIVAAAGDSFKLSRDVPTKTWNLSVNGEIVKSMLDPNRNYFFGASSPATLSLYEKNGKLKGGEIILFAAVPPGDNDSGLFGLFNINDSIGKAEPTSEAAGGETAGVQQAPTPVPQPTATPVPATKSKTKTAKPKTVGSNPGVVKPKAKAKPSPTPVSTPGGEL